MKTTFLSILTLLVSLNAFAEHGSAKLNCASDSGRTRFSAVSETGDPGYVSRFERATVQVDGYWYRMQDAPVVDVIQDQFFVSDHFSPDRLSVADYSIGTTAVGPRFFQIRALPGTFAPIADGVQFRARLVATDPRLANHPMKSNRGDVATPVTDLTCQYTIWN